LRMLGGSPESTASVPAAQPAPAPAASQPAPATEQVWDADKIETTIRAYTEDARLLEDQIEDLRTRTGPNNPTLLEKIRQLGVKQKMIEKFKLMRAATPSAGAPGLATPGNGAIEFYKRRYEALEEIKKLEFGELRHLLELAGRVDEIQKDMNKNGE